MVTHVLGLKLKLLANSLKRSPRQLVGVALAVLYALGATGYVVGMLVKLRDAEMGTAAPVAVVLGSALALGSFVLPFALAADDALDPRRFSLFAITNTRLAGVLVVASLLGVPGLIVTAVAVAQVVTWDRSPVAFSAAVGGAVLIVVTGLLAIRISTALAAMLHTARIAREAIGVATLAVLVGMAPLATGGTRLPAEADVAFWVRQLAGILEWTPIGAAWSAPAAAASGNNVEALQKLLIALICALILALLWRAIVARRVTTSPRENTGHRRSHSGLGWFDRLPATPWGVIAARSFTYWNRDARYRVQLAVIPVIPLLLIAVLGVGGVDTRMLALLPLPIICLFLSFSIHNDVAQDNTAMWLHLAANTSGRADRIGRILPVLILGAVVLMVGAPISAAIYGNGPALPVLLGVSACILLCGLGFSSVSSARFPYAAVRPGDSPFLQPQASGGSATVVQSAVLVATVLATVPIFISGWSALHHSGHSGALVLLAGVGTGVLVLVAGVLMGGRIFERRAPELLAFTQRN